MIQSSQRSLTIPRLSLPWAIAVALLIIARAAGVPNERLNLYLSAFRFGHYVSKEQKAALVELVRERLRVAEAAPRPDENVIKELKRLIEIIPGNISS